MANPFDLETELGVLRALLVIAMSKLPPEDPGRPEVWPRVNVSPGSPELIGAELVLEVARTPDTIMGVAAILKRPAPAPDAPSH